MKSMRVIGMIGPLLAILCCFTGCGSTSGKKEFNHKVELLQNIDKDSDDTYFLTSSDGEAIFFVGNTERYGLFYGVSSPKNSEFVCGNRNVILRRDENRWYKSSEKEDALRALYESSLEEVRNAIQKLSENAVGFSYYPRTWLEVKYPLYALYEGDIYQISLRDQSMAMAFLSMKNDDYVLSWNVRDSWNEQPFVLGMVCSEISDSVFSAVGLSSDMDSELSELLQNKEAT